MGGLYVTGDGRPLSGAAAQPRRLALVALLAVAGDRGVTRDALLAHLWPDSDEERGRRALTQSLYALRRDLGSDEAFVGLKDLRLNTDIVIADIVEFHDALASGNLERAAELYRGPFLAGFHLPGAETFERWVDEQRASLQHEYTDLLDQLADRCRNHGDHRGAVGWLRRRAGLDPLHAHTAARLMEALVATGDVAGALQHARVYETLVRQELDLPPDREVIQLAARLRSGEVPGSVPTSIQAESTSPTADLPLSDATSPRVAPPALSPPTVGPAAPAEALPADAGSAPLPAPRPTEARILGDTSGWATMAPISMSLPRTSPRRARWVVGVVAVAVIIGVIAVVRQLVTTAGVASVPPERVVAIGRIAHYSSGGTGPMGLPLADMLATDLARVEGVRVVSNARMVEVMRQVDSVNDTTSATITAARRAGATELVDGALYEVAPSVLRLDLRRVDLASGAVLRAYTILGPDLFALADSGTARIVADLGGVQPSRSLADVTTRSVVAYQLYEEGLRAYFGSDLTSAGKLFGQALEQDSGFAMAAFYFALSSYDTNRAEGIRLMRRAVALSGNASDRERLLIRATAEYSNSSPALRAVADTMMVRYPTELEGYLMAAQGALLAGEFGRARRLVHEVIARDSLGLSGRAVRCLACEAFGVLADAYASDDSIAGGIRMLHLWTRLQPSSAKAWRSYGVMLALGDQIDSSTAALRTADSLDPASPQIWRYQVLLLLQQRRYEEAEEVSRVQFTSGPRSEHVEALWQQAIALRLQGRATEALAVAKRYRRERGETAPRGAAPTSAALEAVTLLEGGNPRAAALLFDSTARARFADEDSSADARGRVWAGAHAAAALALAGDTARLPGLADSLERLGRVSGLARDRQLHFYVRGLLARARGRTDDAIGAFRSATVSRNMGYIRIPYELGGALLAAGRAKEAIPVLQAGMRCAFEGVSLYLTHTEMDYRLAQAFEAAGERDSAAVHYQRVAKAWAHADPEFTPRQLDAAGRAMRLLGTRR
ncbi:MAG: BTAD domain-containing putative transcriptional regulator [Gemmatimonadales bacterium]